MNRRISYQKLFAWIVTALTPLVILMISVRILITPLFAQLQYQLPGFPDDPYGFTLADRLQWAEPSIRYLINTEDISYLEALTFDDGEPIYNARELDHMEDVKDVVTGMRITLAGAMILLLVITVIAIRNDWRNRLLQAYQRGAWSLIGLIGTILFLLILNFNQLFTWFHQIFFESGTWLFYLSDTLIRLFPLRFWRDSFIAVGLISTIFAVLVLLTSRKMRAGNPGEI